MCLSTGGGGVLSPGDGVGGVLSPGGVYLVLGVYLVWGCGPGGVRSGGMVWGVWSGGGVCGPGGVCLFFFFFF